jgi:hypothetical protein
MLSTRQPCSEAEFARCDQQAHVHVEKRLRKQAAELGFQLAPITTQIELDPITASKQGGQKTTLTRRPASLRE